MIVPLQREKEDKDMLDLILEDAGDEKTCEIAILGEPAARAWAEVKVRATVEKHHPGFADKDHFTHLNFLNP